MLKEKISMLLKRNGRTQKELCSAIGISDTGLRKIFARDSCEISLLKKIADFFGISVVSFFENGECSAIPKGYYSAASVHGNATVNTDNNVDVLKERIKSLEALLEEKERTIQLLIAQNQHSPTR